MKRLFPSLVAVALVMAACDQTTQLPTADDTPLLAKRGRPTQQGTGDPAILAKMLEMNDELAARGLNIAVEAIEVFTIGRGRPTNRIHQQPFRWVPNDTRRAADGENITYLVDQSEGATASGLSNTATEAAIDRAFDSWQNDQALQNVTIIKRTDGGGDLTIFDGFFGGTFGNPFLADIVNAGWLPRAFFEAVGGPGGGRGILAFSVTFIFINPDGSPTDINGDNYLDTALNEVYYNDTFGDSGDDRAGNPWGINVVLPGIDVETVAMHENGHSLELGHFGPPPLAALNPTYSGIVQSPLAADHAGMAAIWASWPNP